MRSLLIVSAVLLAAAPAFAADDIMASTYGNTVIGKSGMGEVHTHYKADHTVTADATSPMGSMTLTGTWKIDDKGQLCRDYSNAPPMMPNPICIPWTAHKVGDTWKVTRDGRTSDLSLVAGIK
ncbi:MAG TPA: hypothetical protein VHL34_08565 [Rhizomicrobium sp.]|jgi:hypothetical protein|nr:hypothetical protein [Rhizomicrobium sp.]